LQIALIPCPSALILESLQQHASLHVSCLTAFQITIENTTTSLQERKEAENSGTTRVLEGACPVAFRAALSSSYFLSVSSLDSEAAKATDLKTPKSEESL